MAYRLALSAIIAIAVGRVVFTYAVFSQTSDEPAHIASGLAWLDRGTYVTDLEHPPLARIATALVPFLSGIRSVRTGNFFVDGVSRTVNLTRRDASDAGLTLNSRTLDSIFGDIAATRSSISVDVGSPLGWAFITVTDANDTYAVLPD